MLRIREITDSDLRQRIVAKLAENRGCAAAAIPDWFELDDADFVDLLNDLQAEDRPIDPEEMQYGSRLSRAASVGRGTTDFTDDTDKFLLLHPCDP